MAEPAAALPLRIDRLGSDGDGTAVTPSGPVFVPFSLPGERVHVLPHDARHARLLRVEQPSPDRVRPPCPLFGHPPVRPAGIADQPACGGCSVQHLAPAAALRWKTDLVATALRRAGLFLPEQVPARQSPPFSRRRMDLAIRRTAGALSLGLHERGGAAVVDLSECHVLRPDLHALLRAAVPVLGRLRGLRSRGSLSLNGLSSGPDLLLRTDAPLAAADRALLADYAAAHAVPRIAWSAETGRPGPSDPPETVSLRASPIHRFGDVAVEPPPGAFLQATAEGEDAIRAAVLDGLPPRLTRSARIVELHAGIGTLSFALAGRGKVSAFEGDPAAAAVLRRAGATRRIDAVRRDLQRQPLSTAELKDVACVVLDPPHGGAAAQMPPLAASTVSRVVYVSCDPAALGRDAALLAAAGFTLSALSVIDQFLWSSRVESVAVFERASRPNRSQRPR
ncbi:MAG: class I SAM-dependent RNA methyltransferase [Gluconacetobacter diazotrophicus]|nr:class I SAM-dependent RNA methyltransferase [Gluconacetobacter diazotrophicus]